MWPLPLTTYPYIAAVFVRRQHINISRSPPTRFPGS